MAFHGGLIGIIISTLILCKKKKINYLLITDLIACAAPIGIFFGRIANFINSELVGRVTNNKIGITFKNIDNLTRHPSQLYEAFLEGFLLFFILFFLKNKEVFNKKNGLLSSYFLIFYSLFRFICEFFREPDPFLGYQFLNLTIGQIYSIVFFIIGIFIFFKNK